VKEDGEDKGEEVEAGRERRTEQVRRKSGRIGKTQDWVSQMEEVKEADRQLGSVWPRY
jgi:hypothetical protein